jgi:hypothetical protein
LIEDYGAKLDRGSKIASRDDRGSQSRYPSPV